MGTRAECKYCGVTEFVQVNEREYACTGCGLLYIRHKSLRTDKVKYIAEEWSVENDGRNDKNKKRGL